MYGKQWGGRSYLDVRTQFGDESMVAGFEQFTNFYIWLLRRLRDGDSELRAECEGFAGHLWEAIDAQPSSKESVRWREDRASAGLIGDDCVWSYEAGYIDDEFGVTLGRAQAKAMLRRASG